MKQELQAVVTILALVNPAMCATIFMRSEGARPPATKRRDAVSAVVAITAILLVAAVAGTTILHAFGVSLNAFACAGGGVLVWIGAGMMTSTPGDASDGQGASPQPGSPIAPLILFAASPGTITGVITVSASHSELAVPVTSIVAIAVTSVVLAIVLMLAARLDGGQSRGGLLRQVVTSYMGLIVIAMGIQFALAGFKAFMASG